MAASALAKPLGLPTLPSRLPGPGLVAGSLSLLILQASPFCNLDCRYCYLPDRNNTQRLPLPLLDRVMRQVMASGLPGRELSIIWHAGEPMAVPQAWYEEAFEIVARQVRLSNLDHPATPTQVTHHFQTNAVLINADWCAFFKRHGVRVGVSIDGPAALPTSWVSTATLPARKPWPASWANKW